MMQHGIVSVPQAPVSAGSAFPRRYKMLQRGHAVPEGFQYVPSALSEALEARILRFFNELSYAEVRMHGVTAKRKVAHFGWVYGYESWQVTPGPPIPPLLLELRDRVAEVIGIEATPFEQALVTEYPQGAGIGWHRDAPMFGPVVLGLSLRGACRLRLRPRTSGRTQFEVQLEPRSLYVLAGAARAVWQHNIPATSEQRYSVTFRTIVPGWRNRCVGSQLTRGDAHGITVWP